MNQRVRAKCDGLKSELVDEFGEDALLSAAVALLAGYVPKSLINQRVVCVGVVDVLVFVVSVDLQSYCFVVSTKLTHMLCQTNAYILPD